MSTEPVEPQPVAAPQDAFASVPQQQEMPLAIVRGEPMLQMPQDLYIPPDALEVILEAFEGPLDLLLYLIRRQNLDILDIPVAEITRQYMDYIEMMRDVMRWSWRPSTDIRPPAPGASHRASSRCNPCTAG
jgi:segregation and condensation protein A